MSNDAQMFRALFETAPDAMIVVNGEGCIVLINPNATRLFDWPEADLLGQPVEMLIPHAVHEAHREHRSKYMSMPRVRPMGAGQELTGLRRDGSQFPVEIALSPIRTDDGAFFVASIRDISDTHRARQALSRARYDTFVAQVGQLALESTVEDMLDRLPSMLASALCVDATLVVFGNGARSDLQLRAVHGVPAPELDPLLDAIATYAVREDRKSDAQPTTLDLPRSAPFELGFCSALAARLFDVDRPMGSVFAVTRSPRVFDREAMHFLQSVANLVAAALQRDRTQEQLAHAQRLDAVGQLTGGIAHDFNNLLTVISGNLQLLEDELADRGGMREALGSALRAVGRGAELTSKLLAFARRQRLSPRAVSPAALLGELGLMLRRTLGERVELEIICPDNMPAVFADPAQLDAALINLALNARDAMPRGGRLRIAVREHDATQVALGPELTRGDYLVFEVSDTGLGMTPDVLARAFEPFFTTKDPGKGSGLGLSMVYGFVKQSGGHLHTDSRLGYGTRVELFLPRSEREVTAAGSNAEALPTRGLESVLVVEDEPEVRGIATAFLRSLGYSVFAVGTAGEAQALLAEHPQISLLFSDVVLGAGATGAELARDARRALPHLAVLLTSGYQRPAADALEQPGSEFELLPKPYRREELAAAVRRALDAR
jgi:PAS domain S-box-containing protein